MKIHIDTLILHIVWKSANDNASAQVEHQKARIVNLELLCGYATQPYTSIIKSNQIQIDLLDKEIEQLDSLILSINKKRKLNQVFPR